MSYAPPIDPQSGKVDSAVNNIPTAFSTAAGSRILNNIPNYQHQFYTHFQVINESTSRLCVCVAGVNDAVPDSTTAAKYYVAGSTIATFDGVRILNAVYLQSDTGSAITSGTVEVNVW